MALQDLGHLLDEANAGAELLEAALPIRRDARILARESNAAKPPLIAALTDGEDYELCFTLSPGNAVKMLDEFRQAFPETLISCIGKVINEPGLKIKQKDGIKEFAAVINPPQGAILAVGAGEQRPVVNDGELAVATVMSCTLSSDHRVVDGAVGAEFMQAFKLLIEDPLKMLL